MKTENRAYTVPSWALAYLINADASGLTTEEHARLTAFELDAISEAKDDGASHWHWSTDPDSQEYFAPRNDVTGWEGGDVEQIILVLFFK